MWVARIEGRRPNLVGPNFEQGVYQVFNTDSWKRSAAFLTVFYNDLVRGVDLLGPNPALLPAQQVSRGLSSTASLSSLTSSPACSSLGYYQMAATAAASRQGSPRSEIDLAEAAMICSKLGLGPVLQSSCLAAMPRSQLPFRR